MRKTYNVLATALLAGVVFGSSISPAFAEETPPVEDSTEFPFVLDKGTTHFTDVKAGEIEDPNTIPASKAVANTL